MRGYLKTLQSDPMAAATAILGVIVLGVALVAFCMIVGVC